MPPAQKRILIAVGLAAGVGLVVATALRRPGDVTARPSQAGADDAAGPVAGVMRDPAADSVPVTRNAAAPARGTGEAYLDHTFRAMIAGQQAELQLAPQEIDRLVLDCLEFREVLSEVAARFVQEIEAGPGAVRLHVPAFPVEGGGVRELFLQRLRNDFPSKADRIQAVLGGYFDEAFGGFGVAQQSFTIRRTQDPEVFDVEWEATNESGRTPSGDPEGPTYAGGSRVLRLARDQLRSGEYAFLAPMVDRRFPSGGGK